MLDQPGWISVEFDVDQLDNEQGELLAREFDLDGAEGIFEDSGELEHMIDKVELLETASVEFSLTLDESMFASATTSDELRECADMIDVVDGSDFSWSTFSEWLALGGLSATVESAEEFVNSFIGVFASLEEFGEWLEDNDPDYSDGIIDYKEAASDELETSGGKYAMEESMSGLYVSKA